MRYIVISLRTFIIHCDSSQSDSAQIKSATNTKIKAFAFIKSNSIIYIAVRLKEHIKWLKTSVDCGKSLNCNLFHIERCDSPHKNRWKYWKTIVFMHISTCLEFSCKVLMFFVSFVWRLVSGHVTGYTIRHIITYGMAGVRCMLV